MGNTFDPNGRGWSDRKLLIGGVVVLVLVSLVTMALLAKSRGQLDSRVTVTASMTNVGDGLPERADVKFRGVLVGAVTMVEPGEEGRPNIVHIDLKPDAAQQIPSTVTARVVPSNVFAVSSIQLIDRGESTPLRAGAVVAEDTELPTALFQSTVNRVRELLSATERHGTDPPVGVLALIAEATNGRGDELLASGARLQRILTEMNRLMAPSSEDPSTMSALSDMSQALDTATPELLDSLENALVPMRTIAEKKYEISELLSAGLDTAGRASSAMDNQMDRLIGITTHLEPVVGVFAQNQDKMLPIATRLTRLADKGYEESWNKIRQTFKANIIVSFTPLWNYIRADCPRYGALEGPSCKTAPEVRQKFDIPSVLLPGSYDPPPELAPPPGAALPPADSEMDAAVGPPPGPAAAPASYGGNVGPVNSPVERQQLSAVLGEQASPAQQLLLGPLARGTVVTVGDSPEQAGGS
jgi:ABC-type transporter Mla subunit MlaD